MMVVDLVGRWGDVIETVSLPPLCVSICVREAPADDRKEHFPKCPDLLGWDKNRPEPPTEVR